MAEDVRDVFICHASEDKQQVVKPLVEALREAKISFWLDDEIKWGDSIIEQVNEGLSKSRYAIVVLSPAFISKHWPQRELNSMLNIEASFGAVKVLPLLVGTTEEKRSILQKLPLLNDKLYLPWENNARNIAESLLKRLERGELLEPTQSGVDGAQQAPAIPSSSRAGNLQKVQAKPPDWLRYKLVAFDLDGTLLKGYKFSWTLIWDYLGYSKKLQKTGMQRYRAGQTTYQQWCEWACKLFIDKNLKRADFHQIMRQVSLTKNFYDTVRTLKREGLILAIISGGIDTFIEEKIPDADKWFDYIFINKLIFDDYDRLSGVVTTDYDFAGKAKALQLICEVNGLKINESVFVGEGFNDQDVACIAGLCIAYPPTDQGVDAVAGVGIEEDDLSLIIEHVLSR